MRLRLIRHATLVVEYCGNTFLVDPMLDDAGARPAIENSPNPRKNPLVPLPIPAEEVVKDAGAVLVTHTHSDHWDVTAAKLLPKKVPLFGQPEDEAKFQGQGFTQVQPVEESTTWKGVSLTRTPCQHGTGEIGKKMAPASGFVLEGQGEASLYLAGDTVWCREVAETIRDFQPKVTVVNSGAAQFLQGDPITMTADCVISVCRTALNSQIVAVHMEAINHCLLTRDDLAFQLESARVIQQVAIPNDGEWVNLK
jgi:L-ascorbate metabolism protein UlaG (beta-lactamase superfamily)